MNFKISYVTTLPLQVGCPIVSFYPESEEELSREYIITFLDLDRKEIVRQVTTRPTAPVSGQRQWYTAWRILISNSEGTIIFQEDLNLKGKNVFIKSDASALGDNLAWMPYIEEFRKKHDCNVICSTFFNELFVDNYPNVLFVEPNTRVSNVYAQYYIGTSNEINLTYSPSRYLENPLQKIACDILGLPYTQIKPKVGVPIGYPKKKKVTLSEYASLRVKEWYAPGGWQQIVDLFNRYGYEVCVVSKEYSYLSDVINKSGDRPLLDRVKDMAEAKYHVGMSTGLSWLAWACHCHVFLISDFTPPDHEFECTRIYNPDSPREVIDYFEIKEPVSVQEVLFKIEAKLLQDFNL
jgi:autotransporter strand-loop-strand O-heptosyltransferase